MASIFSGQFGMFGGGFFQGPGNGQSMAPGMQFGGGFMMNPMANAQVTQEVAVNTQGAVTYAMGPGGARPKDRSGRMFYGGTSGGAHRQKRY